MDNAIAALKRSLKRDVRLDASEHRFFETDRGAAECDLATQATRLTLQLTRGRQRLLHCVQKSAPWMLGALGTEFPCELTGNSASNGFVVTFIAEPSGGEEFAKCCLAEVYQGNALS